MTQSKASMSNSTPPKEEFLLRVREAYTGKKGELRLGFDFGSIRGKERPDGLIVELVDLVVKSPSSPGPTSQPRRRFSLWVAIIGTVATLGANGAVGGHRASRFSIRLAFDPILEVLVRRPWVWHRGPFQSIGRDSDDVTLSRPWRR